MGLFSLGNLWYTILPMRIGARHYPAGGVRVGLQWRDTSSVHLLHPHKCGVCSLPTLLGSFQSPSPKKESEPSWTSSGQ